jgi:L-2-hydroxyglutarate oxidase
VREPTIVIGGGLVGLATALALVRRGEPVVVCEKEPDWAQHQSGNNSGVVHSGIYYVPGSLKAEMARAASGELAAFCAEHDVAYRRTGKMIAATHAGELIRMRTLLDRGRANGVPVREITLDEAREREPHVSCVGALWVESTGVCDFPGLARRLAQMVSDGGAELRLNTEVRAINNRTDGVEVITTEGDLIRASAVANCAGLQSDLLLAAEQGKKSSDIRIVPFRGEYYSLVPRRRDLVRGLVYPVPNPALPFLGVHLTRTVHNDVHVGPNAVLALKREGYRWRDISPIDMWRSLTFPGLWRVAATHGRYGIGEIARSLVPRLFLAAVQQMLPEVTASDLVRSGAGVRAQAVRRDGTLCDDFVLEAHGRVLHVLNAPSPAATTCLQIGVQIADRRGSVVGRQKSVR